MGEKLKKFIDTYAARAKEAVDLKAANLEKYKSARESALKLTAPVNDKYKNLGDLAAEMFPESGGVNKDLFTNVYSKSTFEDADKKVISELFKQKDAPTQYAKAVELQQQGGEKYFGEALTAINKKAAVAGSTLKDLLGDGSKGAISGFMEALDEAEDEAKISAPGRIQGEDLYNAFVESLSAASTGEAKSPINETAAKKETTAAPESSAVNPEKAAAAEKTEVQSTAGQVTAAKPEVPAELESKPATAVNINLETPAAPKETLPATPETSQSVTNVTNVAPSVSKEVTQTVTNVATSSVSQATSVANSAAQQINDLSKSKVISETSKVFSNSGEKLYSELLGIGKEKGFGEKELASFSGESPINTEKTTKGTTTVVDEETGVSSTISAVSGAESTSSEEVESKESSINEAKSAETAVGGSQYGELLAAAQYFGINTEQYETKGKISPVGEKIVDEEVSAQTEKVPQSVEVSKTAQTLPKEPSLPAPSSTPTSAPVGMTGVSPVEMTEKEAPTQSAAPSEVSSKGPAEPAASAAGLGMSGLENRLMRIEHLLAGPLEVKIVD